MSSNNSTPPGDHAESGYKQYKQIPLTLLPRLHELAGSKLSIWLTYLLRGNHKKSDLAWPSLKTLADDTGFKDSDWLRQERSKLVEGGWLIQDGFEPSKKGGSPVPRFRAVFPDAKHTQRKSGAEIVSPRESQDGSTGENQGTPRNSGPGESRSRTRRSSLIYGSSEDEQKEQKEKKGVPVSPLVTAAWNFATKTYEEAFDEPPNWDVEKGHNDLTGLFNRKQDLTLGEFQRRWKSYLDSLDMFYKKNGYSLRLFCTNSFDALRDGPLDP